MISCSNSSKEELLFDSVQVLIKRNYELCDYVHDYTLLYGNYNSEGFREYLRQVDHGLYNILEIKKLYIAFVDTLTNEPLIVFARSPERLKTAEQERLLIINDYSEEIEDWSIYLKKEIINLGLPSYHICRHNMLVREFAFLELKHSINFKNIRHDLDKDEKQFFCTLGNLLKPKNSTYCQVHFSYSNKEGFQLIKSKFVSDSLLREMQERIVHFYSNKLQKDEKIFTYLNANDYSNRGLNFWLNCKQPID